MRASLLYDCVGATALPRLTPASRLLCGPGPSPSNVSPAALAAMLRLMIGHLDPELHDICST